MTLYTDVILPLPLSQAFSYAVPPEFEDQIQPGMRVLVPFGERLLTGFVIRARAKKRKEDLKLKAIIEVLDEAPFFSLRVLSFTEKLSRYYFIPWGEILQAAVPPSFLIRSTASLVLSQKGLEALGQDLLSEEEKTVALLIREKPRRLRFLERRLNLKNTAAVLARMEKKGLILVKREVRRVRRRKKSDVTSPPAQLELDFSFDKNLRRPGDIIQQAMAGKNFAPFLVFGSAGRREAVYFEMIKRTLLDGGRVLYLIPEISLSPALLDKLNRRLGGETAVLHSGLSEKRRELAWQKIREKRARVVVGPRSALFSPLDNLRLIILDEEQDESYGQQEGASFDVRRGAWLRAKEEKAILLMGSAMPTVEAYYRAKKGGYLIDLGLEGRWPRVFLADSRKDAAIVSRLLKQKIKERLDKREPVILFLNRRGYAAYLVCVRCGFIPKCERCDLALSYHKKEEKLICHYCRFSRTSLEECPRCGSRLIGKRGPGIEAVAEDLKKTFPKSRVEILAVDEAARRKERETILSDFATGQVDILIGTQLLVHQANLPPVSLVGILHPEMILHLADFRSSQKAFQSILKALAFLSADAAAEAVIQTSSPEHFSLREAAGGDYRAFYAQEIRLRRLMDYPPFSCLAEVVFQGENLRRLAEKARDFAAGIGNSGEDIEIFGPSLASVARVKGLGRIQVGLKAKHKRKLDKVLGPTLKGIRLKKSVFLFD
jgi:primosomal protein N' (replication factor Y)